MSPAEIIIFYKGILDELSEVKIGKPVPDTACYAQPGAIVTQKWIDATEKRLEQLQGKVPILSPAALRTRMYRERMVNKKNGQLTEVKEKLNGLSKVNRPGRNKKS